MNLDRFKPPPALPALVAAYEAQNPNPVRFRASSWEMALANVPGKPTRLLCDPAITGESAVPRYRALGDRIVTADAVTRVCRKLDLTDDESVVAAFVLVMAWGSGTSNPRSLRYTPLALENIPRAANVLRDSAVALREVAEMDSGELAEVHRGFKLPGIQQPFFTKWFRFAGLEPKRSWQPLILDRRVRNTLNKTLNVWLNDMAESRNDPQRYVAYLTALHGWAAQLSSPVTASRLEWILYMQNGDLI